MPRTINHQDEDGLLERVEAYLQEQVAPQAAAIDRKFEVLKRAWQGLGELGALALRVPVDLGGSGFDLLQFAHFQEAIARYSGALAFLQTQHQSAGLLLANSENSELKAELVPHLATGAIGLGVGFSQLRRQGEPLMKAISTPEGYQLNGIVPWVTGYGLFEYVAIGALLASGEAVYGLVPLQNRQGETGGDIRLSEPMALMAMTSTQTVQVTLEQWPLGRDRVIQITPPNFIHEQDRQNVLKHSFFPLGCARAGLDLLKASYPKKPLPSIHNAYQKLDRECQDCRAAIFQALQQPPARQFFKHHLQLRAWAINLAGRCAQAAAIAASGAANLSNQPPERVYREALMFSVFGQTPAVMEASLAQLLRL
jgi:hypothetical protein